MNYCLLDLRDVVERIDEHEAERDEQGDSGGNNIHRNDERHPGKDKGLVLAFPYSRVIPATIMSTGMMNNTLKMKAWPWF